MLNVYAGQRRPTDDLVLPGLFFVGDSVATATPVFGGGLTTTLRQVEALVHLDHDSFDVEGAGHSLDAFGESQTGRGSRTTSCWTPLTWTGGTARTPTSTHRFRRT